MHLDLVAILSEHRRAAVGAKMPTLVSTCFATDLHGIPWEDGSSKEQGSMMFSAIQAVTNAYAIWFSNGYDADICAQATSSIFLHILSFKAALMAFSFRPIAKTSKVYCGDFVRNIILQNYRVALKLSVIGQSRS
jgi:hypothetical protein